MLNHFHNLRHHTTHKLHNHLCGRWGWYDRWHKHPAHHYIHFGIFLIYIFSIFIGGLYSFYPQGASASSDYTISTNTVWCDSDDLPSDIGTLTINNGVILRMGGTTGNATGGYKGGAPTDACSLDASGITVAGSGNLVVNGTLYVASESSTNDDGVGHTFNFTNVTVASTGVINGFAWGYPNGYGTGKGSYSSCGSGAGHGGAGGSGSAACSYLPSGGSTYGDSVNPITLGSSGGTDQGGQGAGGSAITINSLSGTVTVDTSGIIRSDGQSSYTANSGGGSGGSVLINANVIAGGGIITALGGSAANSNGGAGGGGRVALHYVTSNAITPSVVKGTTGYGGSNGTTNLTSIPAVPSLSSPADASGSGATGVAFQFSTTNADASNMQYQFQIDDDSAFGSVFESADQSSAQTGFSGQNGDGSTTYTTGASATYTLQGTLTTNTTYYWRTRAKAPSGSNSWGSWSSSRSIIVNDPPQVSITNSPSQDSSGNIAITYNVCDTNHSSLTMNIQYTLNNSDYATAQNAGLSGTNSYGSVTGVSSSCDSPSSKSVTFDPSADSNIPASYYSVGSGNFKVRVQAVDGIANGTVNSTASSALEMDNALPATATHSSPADGFASQDNTPTLTASAYSDNTTISAAQWQVDDTNNSFASLVVNETVTDSPTNSYTTAELGNDTFYWRVRYKDAKNNWSVWSTATSFSVDTVSPDATSLTVFDTSVASSSHYEHYLWWVADDDPNFTNYQVKRSTNGVDYTTVSTITDSAQNFYIDSSLNSTTTYSYKITINDDANNTSTSAVDSNQPASADNTAPTISAITTSDTNLTTATITWTTNENANSIVDYGTTTSYGSSMGNAGASATSHSVIITGLSNGTAYKYRIRSADASNNMTVDDNGGAGYSFTTSSDATGPVISSVVSNNITNTEALISWTTGEVATGAVSYSTTTGFAYATGTAVTGATSADTQTHTVQLTELTRNTVYYYLVRSTDASANTTTSAQGTFTTTGDATAPVISSATIGSVGQSSAVVSWLTDEPASSSVSLGTDAGTYSITGETDAKLDRNHQITVSDLLANTSYYVQISSSDSNSNSSTKNYGDDATLTFTTQTVPSISATTVSATTATTATISWTTNIAGDSYIEYGTTASYGLRQGSTILATSHEVALTGLSSSTLYYYRTRSSDANGNLAVSASGTFTTESSVSADAVAPEISDVGPNVSVTADSAVITWVTDEGANSVVQFGTTSSLGQEQALDDSITSHSVTLKALTPSTKYYFKVRSKDSSGNIGESTVEDFTTKSKSDISEVAITDITLSSAIIAWNTTRATTSVLNYGTSSSYGSSTADQSLGSTTKHTIKLENLASGTTYHFKLAGIDDDSKTVESDDYIFTTQTLPIISNLKISEVQANKTTISWATNTATDATVSYGKSTASEHDQGSSDLSTTHTVSLIGLEGQTSYVFIAKSRDSFGNQAVSATSSFTTQKDIYPPEISSVKSEVSTVGRGANSRIQVIISWLTDEPSTSQVEFGTGVLGADLGTKTPVDETLNQNHIVILRDLMPSTTYRFRSISNDNAKNTSRSSDFTILTPEKEESALQIIVKSLEETFGFLGNIKGLFK